MQTYWKLLALSLFLALAFASCEKEKEPQGPQVQENISMVPINETSEPLLLSDPCVPDHSQINNGDVYSGEYMEDDVDSGALELGESGGAGGTSYGGNGQAGTITAGEVQDLVDWDYWQSIQDEFGETATEWSMNPIHRYSVAVRDQEGNPMSDAQVLLTDETGQDLWRAQTDNRGKTELWLDLYEDQAEGDLRIVIFYNDVAFTIDDPVTFESGINEADLPISTSMPMNADVMIAFDATGSMGDELEYIKTEVLDIFSRIKTANPAMDFRFGSVFYRDYGDEYLSLTSDLQEPINATASFINEQHASGGGDFPEAVHIAIQEAVVGQDWAESARARIMFLILDAPPHKDECTQEQIRLLVKEASRKGVKIIPITASGINKETEYLMRFAALASNASYCFITDHSGIGNDHIDPTTLGYEVEFLNDLMVRIVNRNLE